MLRRSVSTPSGRMKWRTARSMAVSGKSGFCRARNLRRCRLRTTSSGARSSSIPGVYRYPSCSRRAMVASSNSDSVPRRSDMRTYQLLRVADPQFAGHQFGENGVSQCGESQVRRLVKVNAMVNRAEPRISQFEKARIRNCEVPLGEVAPLDVPHGGCLVGCDTLKKWHRILQV